MDIEFDSEDVRVSVRNTREISVEAGGIDVRTVLDNFSEQDIVEHFDINNLLDEIGSDEVIAWAISNDYIESEQGE